MDEHLLALFKALLDDPDIQAKLQHIVRTAQQTAAPAPTLPKPQEEETEKEAKKPEKWSLWGGDAEKSQLKRRVSELEAQARQAQRDLSEARRQAQSDAASYRRQLTEANTQLQTVRHQCEETLRLKENEMLGTIQSVQDERDSARSAQAAAERRATDAERELKAMRDEWSGRQRVYDCYLGLSPQFRNSLEGVFHGRDLWTFLVNGVQRDNLVRFLEVCNAAIMSGRENDVAAMNELFDYFFDTINDALSASPIFGRQEVRVGDRFDPLQHAAAPGSRSSGHITRILLPGLVFVASGKLKQPAVVQVGP